MSPSGTEVRAGLRPQRWTPEGSQVPIRPGQSALAPAPLPPPSWPWGPAGDVRAGAWGTGLWGPGVVGVGAAGRGPGCRGHTLERADQADVKKLAFSLPFPSAPRPAPHPQLYPRARPTRKGGGAGDTARFCGAGDTSHPAPGNGENTALGGI